MPDKVVLLKLIEREVPVPKVFNLQVPIGDKAYTPNTYQAICGPANTPWKIPFDVDNPDPETTDELIGIRSINSQNIPLSYSFNDLNENFIELSASPDGQIGTDSTNASFKCQGLSGIMSIRLCSFPNPQAPAETVFNSRVSTIWSTAYVNKYIWESYRYGPDWNPDDPWHNSWIAPNNDWFNNNAYKNRALIVQDGLRPRISFHLEKFRDPRWTAGRFIDCLVINHWQWVTNPDTAEGAAPYIYRIVNQQIIAAKYISDDPFTPKTPLTPSKTKNSTPNGGRGKRNNFSYPVPMPSAGGLTGLSYFTSGNTAGIHLYEIDSQNWSILTSWMLGSDFMKILAQGINKIQMGSSSLNDFVLSVVKLMLKVDFPDAEHMKIPNETVYVGYTSVGAGNSQAKGTSLLTRYAETQTWTFKIEPYSDTFLDFEPHTSVSAHIPFCGVCRIPTDACMGGIVEIKYLVDVVTGSCCAIVRATDQFNNPRIVSVLSGQCGINIPLTSSNHFTNNITGSIGSIVAGMTSGNPLPVIAGTAGLMSSQVGLKTGDTATSGGPAAILGDRALYVAVSRPQDMTGLDIDEEGIEQVNNFGNKVGYTAAYFSKVGDFDDEEYIEAIINPNSISTASDAEKEAIRTIIQRGVYI